MKLSTALTRSAAIALMGLTTLGAQAATTCQKVDEKTIAGLFDRWNQSLATLDPTKVTANYAPDGVLLPTVSNQMRTNHQEIQSYFVDFLKKEPQGVIDQRKIKIGCNKATDAGVYTFTFKGGQKVQARYSYVYEWRDGKWLIAHHHSSAMPEPIKQASL